MWLDDDDDDDALPVPEHAIGKSKAFSYRR